MPFPTGQCKRNHFLYRESLCICVTTRCPCKENDFFCIDRCPEKALTLRLNSALETLGDYRWTSEMIIAHWEMAETGNPPVVDLEYSLGSSGGGFDKQDSNLLTKKIDWISVMKRLIPVSNLTNEMTGVPPKHFLFPAMVAVCPTGLPHSRP